MNNTHYNIIDTLCFAFGNDVMKRIGETFAALVTACATDHAAHELREQLISDISTIPELAKASYAVRYTLLDCFLFGATEGMVGSYVYGFGHLSLRPREFEILKSLADLNK